MHPATHVQNTPDKPAIVMAATGETLTYRQLEDRSNQGAQLFRKLDLQPDPNDNRRVLAVLALLHR